MGTPDFSVPALEKLASRDDIHVSLVITQPDRPKGRGKKMMPSPVKITALKSGIDLYQPERLNTPESIEKLVSLNPDFFVVAAYGQLLSQKILDIPKFYPINIHASVLPKYRGASPIQAAILNMDAISGVTTMLMAKKLDAGDILMSASTPITPEDTAQDLHDRLAAMGADLIIQTILGVLDHSITPTPQDEDQATYVKLLQKSDGRIDWNQSSQKICAHINAMTPWPGAFTRLEDRHIKIFKARASDQCVDNAPGTIFKCDSHGIHVSSGKGTLTILELMGSSGKRLTFSEFLCGHTINPPVQFGL